MEVDWLAPRAREPCVSGISYPRSCLLESIPAWTQSWRIIDQRFGCCLRHHLDATRLLDNHFAWAADNLGRIPDNRQTARDSGFTAAPVMLSTFAVHRFADAYAIGTHFVRARSETHAVPTNRPLLLALNSGEGEEHALAPLSCSAARELLCIFRSEKCLWLSGKRMDIPCNDHGNHIG